MLSQLLLLLLCEAAASHPHSEHRETDAACLSESHTGAARKEPEEEEGARKQWRGREVSFTPVTLIRSAQVNAARDSEVGLGFDVFGDTDRCRESTCVLE